MDHAVANNAVVNSRDWRVSLCVWVPTEIAPNSSWDSAAETWTSLPAATFVSIQLGVRHSASKLHAPSTCAEPKPTSALLTISRGQSLPRGVDSWSEEQFSRKELHKTAGDCAGNSTASVWVPIKTHGDGPHLGQHFTRLVCSRLSAVSRDCATLTRFLHPFFQQRGTVSTPPQLLFFLTFHGPS